MSISIRQATAHDAAAIAPLIYDAIGDIANRLTGEKEESSVLTTLETLVRGQENRHSYKNTFVATEYDYILGIVVLYNGQEGAIFDRMLEQWLAAKSMHTSIDVEAHTDEYYIDTLCVAAAARGKGIGTALLEFTEQLAREKGHVKLSLNVETAKTEARRLYERLGFTVTGPWTIINEPFHHMVKQLD